MIPECLPAIHSVNNRAFFSVSPPATQLLPRLFETCLPPRLPPSLPIGVMDGDRVTLVFLYASSSRAERKVHRRAEEVAGSTHSAHLPGCGAVGSSTPPPARSGGSDQGSCQDINRQRLPLVASPASSPGMAASLHASFLPQAAKERHVAAVEAALPVAEWNTGAGGAASPPGRLRVFHPID